MIHFRVPYSSTFLHNTLKVTFKVQELKIETWVRLNPNIKSTIIWAAGECGKKSNYMQNDWLQMTFFMLLSATFNFKILHPQNKQYTWIHTLTVTSNFPALGIHFLLVLLVFIQMMFFKVWEKTKCTYQWVLGCLRDSWRWFASIYLFQGKKWLINKVLEVTSLTHKHFNGWPVCSKQLNS